MPVAAGVVGDAFVPAFVVVAALDMASQYGGSADGDGPEHLLVVAQGIVRADEVPAVPLDDLGQFMGGFHGVGR